MPDISPELLSVLNSDCAHDLEHILDEKRPEVFDALMDILEQAQSNKPDYISKVIALLGRWGNSSPTSNIISILPQLDENECVSAIDALGRIGSDKAVSEVLKHTTNESVNVRKFVAYALARSKDSRSREALLRMATMDQSDLVKNIAQKQIR